MKQKIACVLYGVGGAMSATSVIITMLIIAFYSGNIAIVKNNSFKVERVSSFTGAVEAECNVKRYLTAQGEQAVVTGTHLSLNAGTSAFAFITRQRKDRNVSSISLQAMQNSYFETYAIVDKEYDLAWKCINASRVM